MSETTQTLFVLGQAAGALLCSSISDRFGRKPTYTVSLMGLLVTGIVLSISPNYAVFATFRFISGVCQQGTDLVIATMLLESVPTEKRFKIGAMGSCLWGTSLALLAPLAFLLKNVSWRYLQLTVALTASYSLLLPFTLEETLRWLVANGKTEEVNRILKKAARMNKIPFEKVLKAYYLSTRETDNSKDVLVLKNLLQVHDVTGTTLLVPAPEGETGLSVAKEDLNGHSYQKGDLFSEHKMEEDVIGPDSSRDSGFASGHGMPATKKYTLVDILRSKIIFKNAVIVWYCWIVCSLVYYGLYMTSSSLTGHRYLDYFLNSAVEVPGSLLIFFTIERFGRRRPSLVFNVVAGSSLLVAVLLKTFASGHQAARIISTVLTLVGKLTITAAFCIMFIYTPELFPTNLRNVGLGAASLISRLGGMLAPFTRTLEKIVPWGSGAIFAAMCLLAGFLVQFLPETRGHELPQTVEEIQEWYRIQGKRKGKGKK